MENSHQPEKQLPLLESIFQSPVLIQNWNLPVFEKAGLEVKILRADSIHPWINGNKAWKLRHLLESPEIMQAETWVSMGGAFSNHLLALSCLTFSLPKPLLAFIRGERTEWQNNPWIQQMEKFGTQFIPLSRSGFRTLHLNPKQWRSFLPDSIGPNTQFIPLGGSSPEVLMAMGDWARQIQSQTEADFWCLPVGTGGTCVGLAAGLPEGNKILAIEAVRIPGGMEADVRRRVPVADPKVWKQITWLPNYAGAGFGKSDSDLEAFCQEQWFRFRLPLEPVYSGKAFMAVSDLAAKGYFPLGSRLLLIHTGGAYPWNSGPFLPE